MGTKALFAAGACVVLLAPGGAALGVATLISPAAAGSGSCLWPQTATGPISLSGTTPGPASGTDSTPAAAVTATNADGVTVALSPTQVRRAASIVAIGTDLGVPARGQLIALMTALTESSLRVLSNTSAYPSSADFPNDGNGGDHDSVGLFQQRPAAGWGTVANLMDPVWSARAFYGGAQGPNHGSPRGLLDIDGWESMPPGKAAQAVQVSAFPDRYATNQPVAAKLLAALAGVSTTSMLACALPETTGTGDAVVPGNLPPGFAGALITAAARQLGKPYVWGGGNFNGPTGGGFDCSGLVLYAAYVASGGQIRLPHYTGDQIRLGRSVPPSDRQPGDLIFFSYPGAGRPHHVAIVISGDKILQAPHTGDVVRYGSVGEFSGQILTVRRLS